MKTKLLFILFALLISATHAQQRSAATLNIGDVVATPGTTVDVPVYASGFQNVSMFYAEFRFDKEVLDAASFAPVYVYNVHPTISWDGYNVNLLPDQQTLVFLWLVWNPPANNIPNNTKLFDIRFRFCDELLGCAENGSASVIYNIEGVTSVSEWIGGVDVPMDLTLDPGSVYANPPLQIFDLTIEGGGTVEVDGTPYTEEVIVPQGTTLGLQAVPNPGWQFANWTGDLSGTANPTTINMNDHKNATANFIPISTTEYTLTLNIAGEGTVKVNGDTYTAPITFFEGTPVTLEALPETGWGFTGWSGNLSGTANPASFTMDDDKEITANFDIAEYNITVLASPEAGGNVAGGGTFEHNSPVSVIATANPGYEFVNWTENGSVVSTNATYGFTALANRTLTANFLLITHSVTFQVKDEAGDPLPGATVTLGGQTNIAGDYFFDELLPGEYAYSVAKTGYITSTGELDVDNDIIKEVTLIETTYTVDFSVAAGNGGLEASIGGSPIASGSQQSPGSDVLFTASPDAGYQVSEWTLNGAPVAKSTSGRDDDLTFLYEDLDQDINVQVSFEPIGYTLSLLASPVGAGELTKTPDQESYTLGEVVAIAASANTGFAFSHWEKDGAELSDQSPYDYTMPADDVTITAIFTINTYTIAATAGEGGNISPSGDVEVEHSASQSFTITPSTGYDIDDVLVDGASVGAVTGYTFTNVTQPHTIHATFTIKTYTIAVSASPEAGGTVGGGGTYNHDQEVTLMALPNQGYEFVNWTENGTVVSTSAEYIFPATGDRMLVANFQLKTYTVAFHMAGGSGSLTATAGGTSIASGALVVHGSDVVFTATPAQGYVVGQWTLNGAVVDDRSPDTFTVADLDEHITVTVAFEAIPYTLDVAVVPVGAGTVSLDPDKAHYTVGEVISLAANPNPGFDFLHWQDAGKSILSTDNPYDYTMPAQNASLEAVFAVSQYTIAASAGANGSINPSGDVVVEHGDDQSFTITPNPGYDIADVVVDGVSMGAVTEYTFENVTQPHTIHATFAINTYTIAASAGAGGSINPSGDVEVEHSASQSFTITPSTGYDIDDVLVDGASVGAVTGYTFTNVTQPHTIHATFTIKTYTIAVSASPEAGGTVGGGGTFEHNQQVTLTASTGEGYEFVNWSEGGSVVSTNPSYSFTATANRTLVANFAEITYTLTFNLMDAAENPISGATISLNGTTNPAGNYVFSGLTAGEYGYTVIKTSYQVFTDAVSVSDDITVDVTLQLLSYPVTFGVTGGNGSLAATANGTSINSGDAVDYGSDLLFTATPNPGYRVKEWKLDGSAVPNHTETTLAVNDIDDAVNVTVEFEEIPPEMYTLTITIIGSGDITINGDTYTTPITVVEGTTLNLKAIPADGYEFSGWSGDLVSSSTEESILMDEDKEVTASFNIKTYTIAATAGDGGSISPSGDVEVNHGGSQSFTISPGTGYEIADVVVDGVSVGAVTGYTFTNVTQPHTIHAGFVIKQYNIAVSASPAAGGTVSGGGTFNHGAEVSLSASPNPDYVFVNWTEGGTVVSTSAEYIFPATGDRTLVANFEEITYTLTVTIVGSGDVTVNNEAYTTPITVVEGTILNLDAIAAEWWNFDGWSGDVPKTGNTLDVLMDGNKNITATFTRQQFTLTITSIGSGSVKVDGTTYSDVLTINGGETVSLLAEPDTYWQFDNWSDNLSGSENPNDLLMDGNKEVTAHFSQPEYTLTMTVVGEGDVAVGGESYTAPIAVAAGTMLNLQALPDEGWYFECWSGDLVGGNNPETILMDGNKTVTATFTEIPPEEYTLTVSIEGSGSVTVDGEPYTQPVTVEECTVLNLQAIAAEGWQFDGWTDDLTGNANPAALLMDGHKTVTANFSEIPPELYSLTVTIIGSGDVEVDGVSYTVPVTVEEGTTLNLEALASDWWEFDGWTGDVPKTGNTLEVFMDSDKDVAATFIQQQFTLTITSIGSGSVKVDGTTYTEELTIDGGETVSLLAEPDTYWQFDNWSGAITGTSSTASVVMDGDKAVTATFTEEEQEIPEHREVYDVIVTGDETVCYDALKTITAWNFIVESGGEAHFLAGERISFLPGTHIKAGAYLHARITADEFCITEKDENETMAGNAITGITGDEEEGKMDLRLVFRVYPNPTTGSFTLELEGACADDQPIVEIMNTTGNLVLRQRLPAMALHTFSLERQQPGIYLVRVICGNQTATQRLIKR